MDRTDRRASLEAQVASLPGSPGVVTVPGAPGGTTEPGGQPRPGTGPVIGVPVPGQPSAHTAPGASEPTASQHEGPDVEVGTKLGTTVTYTIKIGRAHV